MRDTRYLLAALGILTVLGYTNCSGTNSTFDSSTASTSSSTSWTFSYSPNPLYINTTATLATSGGTAPYTYALYNGVGSVNSNFYSTSTEGYATVKVTDATGASQYFNIYAYSYSGTSSYTSLPASSTTDIYRFRDSTTGHFFTASYAEGVNAGMTYEGVGFKVLASYAAGTNVLYRCLIPGKSHFVSTSSTCSGYTVEGAYGYIYYYSATNTAPLYYFYSTTTYDYLATTNYAEGVIAGMTYAGVYGYVPL